MRLFATASLVPTAQAGAPSEFFFLVAIPAAPSSNPSIAASGFRTNGSLTNPRPLPTLNTAGVLSAGTAAQGHPAAGQFLLGLERLIDKARSHVVTSLGPVDTFVVPRVAMVNASLSKVPTPVAVVAGPGTTLGAAGDDCNVMLALVIGTTGATVFQNLSGSAGGLVHVAVFDLGSVDPI